MRAKEEAEAAIAVQDSLMGDCTSALRVFGYYTEIEGVWAQLAATFNEDVQRTLRNELTADAAIAPEASDQEQTVHKLQLQPQMPKVWKVVRDRLKDAGDAGIKAGQIKDYIERTYGRQLHEKTVGMTLYRLSQQTPPLARRVGHTWFFVPPSEAETRNPGVGAPGSVADAQE